MWLIKRLKEPSTANAIALAIALPTLVLQSESVDPLPGASWCFAAAAVFVALGVILRERGDQ